MNNTIVPADRLAVYHDDAVDDKAQVLAAALDYASRGWRVTRAHRPDENGDCSCGDWTCKSVGKHPYPTGWQRSASIDPAIAEEWFGGRAPIRNLALATGPASGFLVIDVDPDKGGDAGFAGLEIELGPLPPTVEVRSGGGGKHFYFAWPAGRDGDAFGNSAGALAPGVDVKVDGGCVMAPPSLHQSERRYAWAEGHSPDDLPLAELPERWLAELARVSRGRASGRARERGVDSAGDADQPAKIREGGRRSALLSLAGTMRRPGMTEAAIRAALLEENRARCEPPLGEDEVREIAAGARGWRPDPDAADLDPGDLAFVDEELPDDAAPRTAGRESVQAGGYGATGDLTDIDTARRLVARYGSRFRWCEAWHAWLVFDGQRWRRDDTGAMMRLAKATAWLILQEAAAIPDDERRKARTKEALKVQSRLRLEAMLHLAKSERGVPVRPDDLDRDPWLLNVENGTLDLRAETLDDRRLRPHDRADLLTKLAPVPFVREATCPEFDRFLARIMAGDAELIGFVQRSLGYALTGVTGEQAAFFWFGSGANGKSTLVDLFLDLLGDYARQTPTDTLMAKRGESIPNDIAALKGARLVAATETDEGRRLSESLLKQLTGGDRIAARFMRAEWFEFTPQFKIILAGNHKPQIRGTDEGIWRRIKLVPFAVTIPEGQREADLPARLRAELPGVLAWAVRGGLAWQRGGLGEPAVVRAATAGYRGDMDVLNQWLEECCEADPRYTAAASDLYRNYAAWIEEAGERPMPQRAFGLRLQERGFEQERGSLGVRLRRGLRLASTLDRDIADLSRARERREARANG